MQLPATIGPYPVARLLGRGGMGSVFLARHPRLGIDVAVKVLDERDPDLLTRFRREAEAMGQINHPNVLDIFDFGADAQTGAPFMAMEFCAGPDLERWLEQCGPCEPEEAVELALGVARGIAAAHAAGVIHRDLKPANVLLVNGLPKVTDFGLARSRRPLAGGLTRTGELLGTPAYMAPEQLDDAKRADERCDVYALGAILFQLVSGRAPFQGPTVLALAKRVLEGAREPLPKGLPPALAEVIDAAMALDPGDRYDSAEVVVGVLEDLQGRLSGASSRALRLLGAALGAALLSLFLLLGVAWARLSERPSQAASTPPPPSPTPQPTSAPSAAPTAPPALEQAQADRRRYMRWLELSRLDPDLLDRAVQRQEPAAITELAMRVFCGRERAADRWGRVFHLLTQAAELGDVRAMEELGRKDLYPPQRLASYDAQRVAWLARATEAGSLRAATLRADELPPAEREALLDRVVEEGASRGKDDPRLWGGVAAILRSRGDHEGAKRFLERALAAKTPHVMADYGVAYLCHDEAGPEDYARAIPLLRKAAEHHLPNALRGLGIAYLRGLGVEQERGLARRYFQEAAQYGDREALRALAMTYPKGEEREYHLRRGAEGGDPIAAELFVYWRMQREGETTQALVKELLPFAALAMKVPLTSPGLEPQKRAHVALQLGLVLKRGHGTERDLARSARLFERAHRLGDAQGSLAYGEALLHGQGVPRDYPAARACLERASTTVPRGHVFLAMLEDRERRPGWRERLIDSLRAAALAGDQVGVGHVLNQLRSVEPELLIAYFVRRVPEGDLAAKTLYGLELLKGELTERDAKRGLELLEEAVAAGHGVALLILGTELAAGKLLPQDLERGKELLRRAERAGLKQARAVLRQLGGSSAPPE